MIKSSPFFGCDLGAGAAEFALLLPVTLLFLFGIIDAGRLGWDFNRAEKATQTGARWAVATDIIPGGNATNGLKNYSFAVSSGVEQGTVVNNTLFPGVYCEATGGTVSCTCKGTCPFSVAPGTEGQAAFDAIVDRMQDIYPVLTADDVRIDYDHSGLGFAGDPNGPDVAPIVTVSLRNMQFRPLTLFLFNADVDLPGFSYSLTMEDGDGTFSN